MQIYMPIYATSVIHVWYGYFNPTLVQTLTYRTRGFNQHPYDNDDKCYKCSTIGEVNILIRTLNNRMVVYINTLYLIV